MKLLQVVDSEQFEVVRQLPKFVVRLARFRVHVYDLPAEFLRRYSLRIIAQNTAGDAVEEDVPLAFTDKTSFSAQRLRRSTSFAPLGYAFSSRPQPARPATKPKAADT